MALNYLTTEQDVSIYRRNLPREFAGSQNLYTHHQQADRERILLRRNMTRALNHHAKRLKKHRQSASANARIALHSSIRYGVNGGINGHLPNGSSFDEPTRLPNVDRPDGVVKDPSLDHDTSISRIDAMSKDALEVKTKADVYNKEGRRSLRQQLVHQRDDPDLELSIRLRNIRKKLNWKTNRPSDDQRPRKRARIDDLPCHAHLTIWACNPGTRDNSWHLKLGITQECSMIRGSPDVDPVKGRFIQFKMDSPFRIPKKQLMVGIQRGNQRLLEMAQKYFMEIKIVPVFTDSDWPPVPLLTRQAVESHDLGAMVRDSLQDCLVASYQKLPDPPDADSPLSISFLKGLTMETKYGLELEAQWGLSTQTTRSKTEHEDDSKLESWMNDAGKPFGRQNVTSKSTSRMARKSAPVGKLRKSAPATPLEPLVTYKFDPMRTKGEEKTFRNLSVQGYACQVCSGRPWKNIEGLLLHLENFHHQFTFMLENEEVNTTNGRKEATIRVEKINERRNDKTKKEGEDFLWVAPTEPFDIRRHVYHEDKSWLGSEHRPKSRKGKTKPLAVAAGADPHTILRNENGGHLPYQHVRPFRPKEHQRQKYPLVRLRTARVQDSTPYASIIFRPTEPDNPEEEDRSETDDEADDTAIVAHYLEELDLHARDQGWSKVRHRLAKRWDYHVLHRERTIHSRYMSDCLIRFVRMEKTWILTNDSDDSKAKLSALTDLMGEMKERNVIDDRVCQDVLLMLYSDDQVTRTEEEETKAVEESNSALERVLRTNSQQDKIRTMSLNPSPPDRRVDQNPAQSQPRLLAGALPSDRCVRCRGTITNQKLAVRCASLDCPRTNLWWHAECAGLEIPKNETGLDVLAKQHAKLVGQFIKERLAWKCAYCEKNVAWG